MYKRDYHLTFCKICKNRKHNLKYGLVCSVTDEIANFEKDCSSFNVDELEIRKIKKRFQSEIQENYATNFMESIISDYSFEKPSELKRIKYKSAEQTHKLKFKPDNNFDKAVFIISGLTTIYVFYKNYNNIFEGQVDAGVKVGMLVLILATLFFYYKGYHHNYKTKISTDSEGINYDNKKLIWNNIVDFGIVITKGGQFNENKIIVGTITKGIIEINLSTLNITPHQFIEIIQLNRTKHFI